MTRITQGHRARQGIRGGRDAALLDIAQDHALDLLHNTGLFERGLVFKGGTALRKFRAGNAGRFSTDLDFATPDEEVVLSALHALDGAESTASRSRWTRANRMANTCMDDQLGGY